MIDFFWIKILLSFITGSIIVILATIIGEKYGTKKGGVIAGLPSTSIVTLFFIGWTQSPATASEAAAITPLIGGITVIFLILYIYNLKRGFAFTLFTSLAAWLLLCSLFVFINFKFFYLSAAIYALLLLIAYYILENKLKVPSRGSKKIKYTPKIIILRGATAGLIMAFGVLMSKFGGPLIGGVFAMFPVVFISTLIIAYMEHGPSFSAALMKSSLFGGISVVAYTAGVYYTYNWVGMWLGTALSLTISLIIAFGVYGLVIKKMN